MTLETNSFSESAPLEVERLLQQWHDDPAPLLQILIGIQQHFNHIPMQAVEELSVKLSKPIAEIVGVIEFYHFLSLEFLGLYDIRFSDNIIEQMKGSRQLAARLAEKLGIHLHKTDLHRSTTIGFTSCIGMGDQGPAALINGQTVPHLDSARIDTIAELISKQIPLREWPSNLFHIKTGQITQGALLNHPLAPGEAIGKALTQGVAATLQEIEIAGLRGRGGAGFTTADKWRYCKQAQGKYRVVICNADEGEPGTFKDRLLLQRYADQVVEGMTLCAATIGANRGFIYLRAEYRFLLQPLRTLLEQRRHQGLLGKAILGNPEFNFDITIHLGAGAYICGEESALIESLEGKRGVPRARPPFPVTKGYLGQPTVVNNVETFMAATAIVLSGAQWYRSAGTAAASGTKLLSISGDCDQPGIYEFAFGTSLKQILQTCGAENTQAVQVGGPSGQLLPDHEFDRCIDFDDLPTGGSLMIFSRRRSILEIVHNFAEFFVHESCGFCTPCRVGSTLLSKRLEKIMVGHATNEDLEVMQTIGKLMADASHCGLGQTAANPILQLLGHFQTTLSSNLRSTRFEPAFDLDAALGSAREITQRSDPKAHLKGGGV